MKTLTIAGALILALALPAAAQVTRSTPGQPEAQIALDLLPPLNNARLTVTSPAFKSGGDIPFENTQYRTNTFPGLTWTKGPKGTKSYVVIMQDNSLILRGAPILHWTLFNIPPTLTSLPAGMAADGKPPGADYGPNYVGPSQPYTGPRTPPNVKDNYHFQVFALDTVVPAGAASSYDVLTDNMNDHVLASGEVVGVGFAPPPGP